MPIIIPFDASSKKGLSDEPVVKIDYKDNEIKIFSFFPGFTISEDNKRLKVKNSIIPFREIGISGTGFISKSGKPLLPSFGRFIQIPPGYDGTVEFDAKKCHLHELSIDGLGEDEFRIMPAQEHAKEDEVKEFEYDDDVYKDDKLYPEDIIEWSNPLYINGYKVMLIQLRPLRYNPSRKKLYGIDSIEVTIKLSPMKIGEEQILNECALTDSTSNLEGFGNFLLNPKRSFFERESIRHFSIDSVTTNPEVAEFLIIYGEDLTKPAQKLKEWKIKRGMETESVPIENIVSPEETDAVKREKIKEYIRQVRRKPNSPLRYVLLFGDVDEIPSDRSGRNTTDHYFYTHKDADGVECLLPWVSGGRIPVKEEKYGMSVVDQIIRYEKEPPDLPDYYKRMTFAAYFQDCDDLGQQDGKADRAYMKTMERIREHMITLGFKVNRVYVSNTKNASHYSDGSSLPQEVKEAIIDDEKIATKRLICCMNEGQLLVSHRDHGHEDGWDHPPFKESHVRSLSGNGSSILFSINCLTGSFDQEKEKCFAEKILEFSGGPPSLIASTEGADCWRNDSMTKALFDAIWPGVIPTFPFTTMSYPIKYHRLGDILNYAKAYLLVAHGFNADTQKHFEIFHIIGDPTLQIWGDEPSTLRLNAYMARGILFIKTNSCPKDSVLTIWHNRARIWRTEPSSTRLGVPLLSLEKLPKDAMDPRREIPYPLSVCFSAPGHRFVESTVWF